MIPILSGLAGGFVIGLITVKILLRGKAAQELRTDKTLHKKYGTLVWVVALIGGVVGYFVL